MGTQGAERKETGGQERKINRCTEMQILNMLEQGLERLAFDHVGIPCHADVKVWLLLKQPRSVLCYPEEFGAACGAGRGARVC